MSNPFQEQLLKAGLVSKQQVDKVNREKNKKNKVQRHNKKAPVKPTKISLEAQKAANAKASKDKELNLKKKQQAEKRAISLEIDKLITDNLVKRDNTCEVVYNFDHRGKVRRLYVNEQMRKDIIAGKAGMARIDGRYELVPKLTAEKIQARNPTRVLLLDSTEKAASDVPDEYADYEVPDDLIW